MTNNNGHRKTKLSQRPFIGDMVKETPIKNKYESSVYDATTNERLDLNFE